MISLDIFVTEVDENVNLLYTKDFDGLNAGFLFFRVSEWTTLLLSTILAIARPDGLEPWDFWEQGALAEALKYDYLAKAAVELPKDWINRYPYLEWNNATSSFQNHVTPGTFLVHLAGPDKYKPGWFDYFLDIAESSDPTFHNQTEADLMRQEVAAFWAKRRMNSLDCQRHHTWKCRSSFTHRHANMFTDLAIEILMLCLTINGFFWIMNQEASLSFTKVSPMAKFREGISRMRDRSI